MSYFNFLKIWLSELHLALDSRQYLNWSSNGSLKLSFTAKMGNFQRFENFEYQ